MTPREIESLARATLGNALIQLAVHFPDELDVLGVDVPRALTQAIQLAEEAIALAPHLPDGHTTLARVILCHDDEEAARDAESVARHALELVEDHDPAAVALATALDAQGRTGDAHDEVERVIQRGSGHPAPFALRARLRLTLGNVEGAVRDIERALVMAPEDGLLRLDAARVLAGAGDNVRAEEHRERARELLGTSMRALVGDQEIA
ncbi:MAG: hypothetical protein AAB426_07080 [Myxococcota bacterium]